MAPHQSARCATKALPTPSDRTSLPCHTRVFIPVGPLRSSAYLGCEQALVLLAVLLHARLAARPLARLPLLLRHPGEEGTLVHDPEGGLRGLPARQPWNVASLLPLRPRPLPLEGWPANGLPGTVQLLGPQGPHVLEAPAGPRAVGKPASFHRAPLGQKSRAGGWAGLRQQAVPLPGAGPATSAENQRAARAPPGATTASATTCAITTHGDG